MRLIPFTDADDLHRRLAKASEQDLPTDECRGAFIPGDDPVELRQVRRLSFSERSHVAIGIKGGQGRSGAELEISAGELALCLAIPVGIALGCFGGHLIATAADAAGRLLSPLFF